MRKRMHCKSNMTTKEMNGSNDSELWLNKVHIKIEFIKNRWTNGWTNTVATGRPNTARYCIREAVSFDTMHLHTSCYVFMALQTLHIRNGTRIRKQMQREIAIRCEMKMLLHYGTIAHDLCPHCTSTNCTLKFFGKTALLILNVKPVNSFWFFISVSSSMFKVKCDKSANVMVCLVRVRWKRVGCVCRISVWWATIWKIASMGHPVWWWAIVCTAAVKIPFNIITETVCNQIILHRVRTVYRPIRSVAGRNIVEKIIGTSLFRKKKQYFTQNIHLF